VATPPVDTLPTKADAPAPGTVPANQTLVDLYIERAVDLLRLEAGTRDKVLVFLDELEPIIVSRLAAIDPTAVGGAAQTARLARLLTDVRGSIKGTYRDISTLMAREIREVVDVEATWTASAINSSIGVEFADAGITRESLANLVSDVLIQGASSKEWWSRQAGGLAQAFADQMRQGIVLGESNSDLVARLRGKTGVRGIMDISKTSAERIVRSSVQTAANVGRTSTYANNADIISAVQWHATLDTRTSIMCLARDGHKYSNDASHAPKDGGPPWDSGPGQLHWNCRSTSVPVMKSWKSLGIDAAEIPDTTRASMDGQVAAQTTFTTWLAKQSAARQDSILGAGKAALYRSGKISVSDLLDQDGRPLTTEQLRAKASK
jgi:SPP1 gp7 family putative phage head morphogenesis protein